LSHHTALGAKRETFAKLNLMMVMMI